MRWTLGAGRRDGFIVELPQQKREYSATVLECRVELFGLGRIILELIGIDVSWHTKDATRSNR